MDEETVMRIAKFYDDTRTWRNELRLAGCKCEAEYLDYYHNQVLRVNDGYQALGWEVYLEGKGFRVRNYRRYEKSDHHFDTAEKVMDWLSDRLRENNG